MQEDHVSMGWNAARKLRTAVENLRRVLAIELLTAARAVDLRAPLAPSPASIAVIEVLRETRSEEHTSELQSRGHIVCRLLLEKKKRCSEAATGAGNPECN